MALRYEDNYVYPEQPDLLRLLNTIEFTNLSNVIFRLSSEKDPVTSL